MNINLNNYEQYLLMYVDNELSAAERLQVEEFLRDYPYLQEELEVLQQTVLPIENIQFDKSSLLKPMLDEAMQEKLLMHLDGELPAGESLALQNSLQKDGLLKKEWNLLQKTKLDAADIIEHPDKESLYRRERAKLITGRFVRWAVAAMLIGAGFYAGVQLLNNNNTNITDVATTNPASNNKNNNGIKPEQKNTATVDANDTKEQPASTNQPEKTPSVKADVPMKNDMLAVQEEKQVKENTTASPKQKAVNPSQSPEREMAATQPKQENKTAPAQPKELPQRDIENVLKSNNDIAAVEKIKNNNSIDLPTNISSPSKQIIDKDLGASRNAYAQTAALGLDDNNQNQIL
ncbi:MAG: hypothetical protein EOO03_12080, partial [Chitinophagaceae bacterium]